MNARLHVLHWKCRVAWSDSGTCNDEVRLRGVSEGFIAVNSKVGKATSFGKVEENLGKAWGAYGGEVRRLESGGALKGETRLRVSARQSSHFRTTLSLHFPSLHRNTQRASLGSRIHDSNSKMLHCPI